MVKLAEKVSRMEEMDIEMIHKKDQEVQANVQILLEKKTETIDFLQKKSEDLSTTCRAVYDAVNEQQKITKRQVEVLEAAYEEETQKHAGDQVIIDELQISLKSELEKTVASQ